MNPLGKHSAWAKTSASALVGLVVVSACATEIQERCRLVTEHVPAPPMPPGFAEMDHLLMRRAVEMMLSVRGLKRSLTVLYKREFSEQLLPGLCERIEHARAEAAAGHVESAGTDYQGLLVASQVMAFEVVMAQLSDWADEHGQPSLQIADQLGRFDRDMAPLMEAALSNDRGRLARSMPEGVARYNVWLSRLDLWSKDLELGERRVHVARVLWDTFMAVVAAYETAGAMAEVATAGLPPPPGIAGVAGGGSAAMTAVDGAALARFIEAIRRLIAQGALDPTVVAGLSMMGNGTQSVLPVDRPMAMANAGSQGARAKSQGPPKVSLRLELSKKRFGAAARHWEEAQKAGHPRFLTIERTGAEQRRADALQGLAKQTPLDLDEYPPAMFKEGGAGAHVRAINMNENRAIGAYVGQQCMKLQNGATVELVITE